MTDDLNRIKLEVLRDKVYEYKKREENSFRELEKTKIDYESSIQAVRELEKTIEELNPIT